MIVDDYGILYMQKKSEKKKINSFNIFLVIREYNRAHTT
jgi:hypothetical protein